MITRSEHRKILIILLLVPLLLTARQAGTAQSSNPLTLTLERALTMAMEQNRDLTVADQDRRKADAQIGEARSGALPQLTLSGQYTRNIRKPVLFIPPNSPINPSNQTAKFELGSDNSYAAGATLSQALYSRKVGVALDIATTYHDFVEQGYQATASDVTLAVKRAFYGALLAQRLVETNRQGLSVVEANVRNVDAQYRHGTAAEFDLLRAQVELANTEPLLISAENNLHLALNALKNLLAIPLEQEIELSGDLTIDEVGGTALAHARTAALEANPMVQQLRLLENLQEMNISIESATLFPSLSLVGSYQWQTQDNTFHFKDYLWAQTLNVGLQLSFPLFDGFRTSARTEEAEVEFEKAHITRLKAEEGLRLGIQAAELNMAEARKRITGREQSVAQARKAMRIAETRFKSGVGTQLELLDAQVAMTRTETMYAQAQYDYLVARAEWQHAVGQTP
jgi:outer membrane protein